MIARNRERLEIFSVLMEVKPGYNTGTIGVYSGGTHCIIAGGSTDNAIIIFFGMFQTIKDYRNL